MWLRLLKTFLTFASLKEVFLVAIKLFLFCSMHFKLLHKTEMCLDLRRAIKCFQSPKGQHVVCLMMAKSSCKFWNIKKLIPVNQEDHRLSLGKKRQ